MIVSLAILAAVLCAIFNGSAAIFEKLGAGNAAVAKSSHPGFLWSLKNNTSYLIGILLDILAFILTLYAVHNLPLIVVQPIIACSVIVTALIESFVLKYRLSPKFMGYIIMVAIGIIFLSVAAEGVKSPSLTNVTRLSIMLAPLGIVLIGSVFSMIQNRYTTFILAVLSGAGFGGVSVAGSVIKLSHPYLSTLANPLSLSIAVYGGAGILFFTIALQRASATAVNACMISSETLFPIIVGLALLGEKPRHNLWYLVVLGICITFCGTLLIALAPEKNSGKRVPKA